MSETWTFTNVWNDSLLTRKERVMAPRDHLWASELGNATIDTFLKLKGVPPTNPPNPRSLRKFEAGHIWEWLVELILRRADLLQEGQTYVRHQYDGLLAVTGKLDFMGGGQPDYERALAEINTLNLPEIFTRATENIVKSLQEAFPDGLPPLPLEIKSSSAYMYDVRELNNAASENHEMQLFHYLKGLQMSHGNIVYICKDDCRMMEFAVTNPSERVEALYRSKIEEVTRYVQADEMPPKEPMIKFENNRFSKNWRVAYSDYLTKLYGFENQKEFDDVYDKKAQQWNRVYKRCVDGNKLTAANKEIITDIKKEYPHFDELVEQGKEVAM